MVGASLLVALPHRASRPLGGTRRTLLDAKAPNDAAAFKTWLRDIGQKTAEAANEGGFFGFGGVPVSELEKATLADIANALNTSPAARA